MLEPEKWVENFGDSLFAFALKRLNNDEGQAQDIVQEVFLSAWRTRDLFSNASSEKTWLFAICKNKIIDVYRKRANRFELASNDWLNEEHNYFLEDGHMASEFKPLIDWSSVNSINEKDFLKVFEKCKSKLNQQQATAFTFKYIDGFEAEEICEMLAITTQNYWTIIHRAKMQLRTCLEKNWIKA